MWSAAVFGFADSALRGTTAAAAEASRFPLKQTAAFFLLRCKMCEMRLVRCKGIEEERRCWNVPIGLWNVILAALIDFHGLYYAVITSRFVKLSENQFRIFFKERLRSEFLVDLTYILSKALSNLTVTVQKQVRREWLVCSVASGVSQRFRSPPAFPFVCVTPSAAVSSCCFAPFYGHPTSRRTTA